MDSPHIIIAGNIFDGMQFYGPFADAEEAIEWAERELRQVEWLFASLQPATPSPV
jgi:hypothetical protein